MPETRDKRRKSDLDLFVLALIRSGVSTPYALQKEAGLSPGATVPSIQRLLDAGLIRQGNPGLRGRTDARISAAGKKQLKNGWRALIDEGPSGDLDADLRIALLAIVEGSAYPLAREMLRLSAAKMLEGEKTAARKNDANISVPLARVYRDLRSRSVRALLDAQAAAAITMADSLPRKLAGKSGRTASSPSTKASLRRVKRLE